MLVAASAAREMQKLCIDGAINLIEDFAQGARLSMFLDCMWKHIFSSYFRLFDLC